MAKSDSLIELIHSLTKAERRYFKLFTALQKGNKDYLLLFTTIDAEKDLDAAKDSFCKKRPKASYKATRKYLYKVIIDCLLQNRTESDTTARLINGILSSRILFEKSMYEDGFKLLQKIQKNAAENEEINIQLWATQIELYYLSHLNFHTITENQLIQRQMKIDELLKFQKNVYQHTSLYELLRHRLMYKGVVRTKEQKDELNDLVVSELNYNSNPLADTFESEKIHLLFQSYYFITINDHKSALKTFYELNNLFENHKHLWIERPIDYLSTIEGVLDSLQSIKRYKEIHFFLNKLQQLAIKSIYFEVMVERVRYIYTITGFLNTGEFDKAEKVKQEFENTLFKKISFLDLSKQAEVYLYSAIIFIGNGDMNKAHQTLNKIFLESKLYYALPSYRTFRLLHLLVHYELGNHVYIEYETRSLKRTFSNEYKKSYQIEKIVFRFLQNKTLPSSLKAREIIWQKCEQSFATVAKDKYEMQLLKIFDFPAWIEAKLMRESFSDILMRKIDSTV